MLAHPLSYLEAPVVEVMKPTTNLRTIVVNADLTVITAEDLIDYNEPNDEAVFSWAE
jgi:hypothetical protein